MAEEVEYESDPEEAKLALKMRRREASDDEEDGKEGGNLREKPPRRIDDSDGESEGAAAEYEDELKVGGEDYDLDGEYSEEEEEVEPEESGGGRGRDGLEVVAVDRGEEEALGAVAEEMEKEKKGVNDGASEIDNENNNIADAQHEEERKEIEPFSVPTAGAFYMHDDRFRDNAAGRNRRIHGGRKLWESKDNRKWGHDKFEELTMQERHHEEHRRGSRGRYRGHGRNGGAERGYAQGNRSREYTNNDSNKPSNNKNNAPKGVRGRGPRRYRPSFSNEAPIAQNKQTGKSVEKHSYSSSGRTSRPVSNVELDAVPPRKQVASNLNVASPPFYPTGSSTKDSTVPLKRDVQADPIKRNGQQSVADESFNMPQSTGIIRGKNIVDSVGVSKLYIADSPSPMAGKPSNTMLMPPSDSSSIKLSQPQLRGQLRELNSLAHTVYQPAVSSNQVNGVPSPGQLQSIQRNVGQACAQSSGQASVQQFAQCLSSGPQASSPPESTGAMNEFESGEKESMSVPSQMKTALLDKGKGGVQGSGKGSFMYGGVQAMGASGSMCGVHGDQNFPAFLPVMQFGSQRPGGISVPAVGMAFPGYVAQPQLGLGSSEMTWLPVIAGAAGTMGAGYRPPYITVDGSDNARSSGQAPSTTSASSEETNTVKVGNDWKPAKKPELASDDFGQRQKNPRRYTEMKFNQ